MIIQAFNDIPRKPLPEKEGVGGFDDLRTIAALQVGTGNRAFKADQSGQWMGANKFANAPFRVNMAGDVVASSIVLGSGYTKINIFKQDGIPTSISTGDLWFDTNDANKLYRAGSAGANEITGGEWEAVRDTTIADAQDTADSKINVFAQDAIPTSLAIGDLWFDTNDDNKPYIAESVGANEITGGEWVLIDDQRAADAILQSANTTLSAIVTVGAAGLILDGPNKRFVINDGTTNRAVMGDV